VLYDGNFQTGRARGRRAKRSAHAGGRARRASARRASVSGPKRMRPAPSRLGAGPEQWIRDPQPTATALVAEMRNDAQMAAISSIPTNGDNQDIVSVGPSRPGEYTIRPVVWVRFSPSRDLRWHSSLPSARRDGPRGARACAPRWMPGFAPVRDDRALRAKIADRTERGRSPTAS
jgi:hypothetical protein